MEAVTRKELFMAAAAGENVSLPKPVTREEMFLKHMADNSAAKYFVEQTETLLDKEYDIDNSSTKRDALAVTEGDNVRVTFDGAEYNCTAQVFGNYIFHDATSNLLFQIQHHKYYNKKYKRKTYETEEFDEGRIAIDEHSLGKR